MTRICSGKNSFRIKKTDARFRTLKTKRRALKGASRGVKARAEVHARLKRPGL